MSWWQYLVLVNIYLLLFYGFYALLLSRETFFQLNRIYLVSAALLSFFIPVIQSDWVKNLFITQKVEYTIYSSPVLQYRFKPIEDTHLTVGQLLVIVYLAGMAFLLARFCWQLILLNKIIKKPKSPAPYSFFKKVALGDDSENHTIIAAHENVHASQWHSADVLIMEAVMIINWFNPVVYLYRFAIKHIHEFIADRQALKSGTKKAEYALILLGQTFNAPAHQLVNPFFSKSLLKQRILMLQKNKSQRIALAKYFLSAPLFILMLILSSATVNNNTTLRLIGKKVERVFLIPAVSAAKPTPGAAGEEYLLTKQNKGTAYEPQKPVKIARKDTTPKKDGPVFTSVEQVPRFPGGVSAFSQFLAKNIRYPQQARQNNVQGRVIISFIVETDGTLTNFKVVRDVGYGTDEEAVRVLKASPRWTPGTQNGKLVRVAYTVPINFTLTADETQGRPAGQKTGAVMGIKGTLDSKPILTSDSKLTTDTGILRSWIVQSPLTSTNPLFIVDGRQVSDISTVNPEDIESISVLKDKSATALYGPKGATGVVVITTKKYAQKNKLNLLKKN